MNKDVKMAETVSGTVAGSALLSLLTNVVYVAL